MITILVIFFVAMALAIWVAKGTAEKNKKFEVYTADWKEWYQNGAKGRAPQWGSDYLETKKN